MGVDTFGEQLKHERESRKVALDDIARSTKIRVRYLQALEQGEHERLPGIVFAKGYVRAYAETIGADPDRLVSAYVKEQRALGRLESEASQERVLEALAAAVNDRPDPAARRMKSALIGMVAIVVLVPLGWFGVRSTMNRDPEPNETPTPQVATMMPIPTQDAPPIAEPGPSAIDAIADVAPAAVEPPLVEQQERIAVVSARPQTVNESDGRMDSATKPVDTETSEPAIVEETRTAIEDDTTTVAEGPILSVPDHGVGIGVEQRALVGESSTFETGTQVVFWTRVLGGESGRSLRHVWSHEGSVTGMVELSIGAAHWRTYSRQTLRSSGEWTVEAQDEDGNVLARRTFVASPA